jgi:hypothetical protein
MLWDLVSQIQLGYGKDNLIWRWTPDRKYFSKSAYISGPCSRIGKTWAPLRVKFFLWLAIRGCHRTADKRRRHRLHVDDHCYLCDQNPETIDHIIASYSFSRQVWWTILAVLEVDAS